MPELEVRVTVLETHEKYQDEKIDRNQSSLARLYVGLASIGISAVGVLVYWVMTKSGIPLP
ncbi:hypothetical protein [Pacificispira sp.]|uniref:hypothetical protein n=1 Tax=Pacificispira sp. TaxID=2888761 RepID=UPI003BA99BBC